MVCVPWKFYLNLSLDHNTVARFFLRRFVMSNKLMAFASNRPAQRLAWKIGAATLSRLSLNTARRFAYPFAPALSRGLGVP